MEWRTWALHVVGMGINLLTVSWNCGRMVPESLFSCGVAIKSPETVSGAPDTSSAEEQLKSSLGAVRMPNNTHGSSTSQLGIVSCACKAAFK